MSAENPVQIVRDCLESIYHLFLPKSVCLVTPEFHGRVTTERDVPVPAIKKHKHQSKHQVNQGKECKHSFMFFVDMMVPNSHNRNAVVDQSNKEVKNEKEEVAIVL
jgi:hypothetical protein